MIQIIYASAEAKRMTNSELTELLEKAREKNEQLNITGFLLYDDSSFLQVLEGPDAAVEAVMGAIMRDDRHTNIRLLSQKQIAEREFGEWAMAFAVPEGDAPSCDGFLDYAATSEEFSLEGSEVSQILSLFQQGLLRQSDHSEEKASHFTVTVGSPQSAYVQGQKAKFLMDFGRALALTVPDVQIGVNVGRDPIHFNLRRDMEKGEIELF
ncbi:protein of unknown function [Magnetospirillum gryphiswaldense MSR-1 v2]|uniref:BLUF domain-containing protein n=1 Tax=Magnetospirillum gryphiswaldense (strain DSM 6361 / JCM 21280 / NBRC 15271 / MSR-1) TaxID=431944 RepID=V6EZV4_MAGGM|nr:BLUF domain-containing protein [Magnetospirillum gryphiswaldense]CDK98692.1 protein of unknown function [Magnetospirillum gryphiswaldense MSR-1 v2]